MILTPSANCFVQPDHLGTPRAVYNSAGTVIWRWVSDPFGAIPANEDPDGNGVKFTLNLRFPGQYFDKESGLHYNYFRDYDPSIGRYVQSDPIGLKGGVNVYAYVGGNPLRWIDPYGLSKFDKTFGLPKDFWNWYHRKVKKPGDPDLEKEEAKQLCDDWKKKGQPGPDNKKPYKERGEAEPSLLEWLIPWPLTSGDAY